MSTATMTISDQIERLRLEMGAGFARVEEHVDAKMGAGFARVEEHVDAKMGAGFTRVEEHVDAKMGAGFTRVEEHIAAKMRGLSELIVLIERAINKLVTEHYEVLEAIQELKLSVQDLKSSVLELKMSFERHDASIVYLFDLIFDLGRRVESLEQDVQKLKEERNG